jgi:hypothetical protein
MHDTAQHKELVEFFECIWRGHLTLNIITGSREDGTLYIPFTKAKF